MALPALALFQPYRSIGGIVANITIQEEHLDALNVTEHPVENNAAISDHAYRMPSELVVRAGWSNSDFRSGSNPQYVVDIYQQLLAMQQARQLIQIFTGKRLYNNMLIRTLSVTTDEKSETALFVTIAAREVILAVTRTVQLPSIASQRLPQTTAAPVPTATQQVIPSATPVPPLSPVIAAPLAPITP